MSDLAVLLICVIPSVCMLLLGAYIRWSTYYTRNFLLHELYTHAAHIADRFINQLIRFRKHMLKRETQQQHKLEVDQHPLFQGWEGGSDHPYG